MEHYEERRERQRRWMRRNWLWMLPVGAVAGTGMFIAVGFLVTWLWRVTVGDIFGFKAISFWQAWGLILLSQILFKANMQRSYPMGPTSRRRLGHFDRPSAEASGPEPEVR